MDHIITDVCFYIVTTIAPTRSEVMRLTTTPWQMYFDFAIDLNTGLFAKNIVPISPPSIKFKVALSPSSKLQANINTVFVFQIYKRKQLRRRMSRWKLGSSKITFASRITFILILFLQYSSLRLVQCQFEQFSPPLPASPDFLTAAAYNSLENLTADILSSRFVQDYSFCIQNPEAEWNKAFNYSSDASFLTACLARTGDVTRRLCTAIEVSEYLDSLRNGGRPNRNCNSSHWVAGCEPGWACSIGPDEPVDLQNSRAIPTRVSDCGSCCEGFFCPTACPLGSYCPLATHNRSTGRCEPYSYQLPSGLPNHTCGGANIWADARSNNEVFCDAGSYCPTITERVPCSSGNYCPMGSTDEKRCITLTTCDSNAESQNIHAYGVMLIAALSTILLIIYNCSDQILTTRERRYAKYREAAARTAREKTQARARWKSAKEAAKKRAVELQSQISDKFSRRSFKNPDEVQIFGHAEETGDLYPSTSTVSHLPTDTSEALDSAEPRNKNVKKKNQKEKEIHTRSQIFKYAYSRLEREKAQQQQNKNLTFSGVISMATDSETKKRPLIEIAFSDLTVTLKGKHKNLMRAVTGKIKPGRITAIMGPSGAGKTTLLSALTGKAVGFMVNGTILINGKSVSIHSYRKIIGFVPQDDIVHGNLTVEENLWFSARCRLSADLAKPDKVLTVERVIDSLGLQAIRGSLVGTVEKRGISGGQRKRVNVGIELVMEPSLLFLDEPTSGLDSSSSQLLLRALRREALEGVNICMVVHQPSYTLFQMFDDLVLLAKGGLTVYHGPARKAEEYFSSLGIIVPDRVNPPDYFIDILEGMIKTSSSSGVNYTELPVRWMMHNGYPIPPDMRINNSAGSNDIQTVDIDDHQGHDVPGSDVHEQSFAREVWQDVKANVQRKRDRIKHNFLKSTDLSHRRTPNIFLQYKYFLGRLSKQRMREAKTQAVDYLILLIAGACLGSLTTASDATFGFALLCKIAALRTFSQDKLQYWRESASGISSLAHFISKDTVDLFNTLIKPVVYLSMFYFFSNPRSSFADNYVVLLCLVYCVTGIAYALAIFLEPGPSQLCSVLLPVVLTLISTQLNSSRFVRDLANFCYPKWALEAFVIANSQRYYGVWLLTRCGALMRYGYNVNHWALRLCLLILAGAAFRVVAFIGMPNPIITMEWDRQRAHKRQILREALSEKIHNVYDSDCEDSKCTTASKWVVVEVVIHDSANCRRFNTTPPPVIHVASRPPNTSIPLQNLSPRKNISTPKTSCTTPSSSPSIPPSKAKFQPCSYLPI
ncbi:ABC transporter g family member 24 [Phtheirospermum japonicum]|uniref:ABC transporter g family member 24 n=1 Tax=Phtheirospermum japonicum TaxID=374723 RepID=A0A830CCT0_9LAMI|nr:ABC transporter g family member 24 [Phtheirospermum japonicum]